MKWGRCAHTLGSGPARKLAGKLDTNDLGSLQLPRKTGHDVDGVSTTNTNGSHTETTSIRSVRVSTDEKSTRESVVLKHDLVDDTRAGLPETDVVLCARGGKEVVDFLVDLIGAGQILLTTNLCLDKMVTVDGGGCSNRGQASGHELEDSHLRGRILASYTVGAELEVAGATLNLLTVGVVQMRVQNLFGEGERAVQASADNLEVLAHLLVVDEVALLPVGHFDLAGERSIADGGQLPARSKALAQAAEPRELLHGGGLGRMEWRGGMMEEAEEKNVRSCAAQITNGDQDGGDWLYAQPNSLRKTSASKQNKPAALSRWSASRAGGVVEKDVIWSCTKTVCVHLALVLGHICSL